MVSCFDHREGTSAELFKGFLDEVRALVGELTREPRAPLPVFDKVRRIPSRSIAQHSIAQHSMAQHSMAQHSMAQHSIARHSIAWHSIA
jgi:hypothetical protein